VNSAPPAAGSFPRLIGQPTLEQPLEGLKIVRDNRLRFRPPQGRRCERVDQTPQSDFDISLLHYGNNPQAFDTSYGEGSRAQFARRLTVEFVNEFVRGKKASTEPAFDRSLQMAKIVAAALDDQEKSWLLDYLGLKPGATDRRFMKSLRSLLFEKQNEAFRKAERSAPQTVASARVARRLAVNCFGAGWAESDRQRLLYDWVFRAPDRGAGRCAAHKA